jgi:lipid-binding SYLF domain-containing protein
MQTSGFRSAYVILAVAAGLQPAAAEGTAARLEKAVAVLDKLTDSSGDGIRPEEIASADCVAVIPGFYKGAAVVGVVFEADLLLEVSFGRGFIACRNGDNWSAPAAITMEAGSLGLQIGENIDIVILSLDKQNRSKLLSGRFTIGLDASAAWGNGKSSHGDPNATILFFGHTKGSFAGFALNGAMLKPDETGNKALYGKPIRNGEVVEGSAAAPAIAQRFVSKLTSLLHPESSTP